MEANTNAIAMELANAIMKGIKGETNMKTYANTQDNSRVDDEGIVPFDRYKAAIYFEDNNIYGSEDTIKVADDIRAQFCNVALTITNNLEDNCAPNISSKNIPGNPFISNTATCAKNIIIDNFAGHFSQAYSNLSISLINSIIDLANGYIKKYPNLNPINYDDYSINKAPVEYDIKYATSSLFDLPTTNAIEETINSGLFQTNLVAMVTNAGSDLYNAITSRIVADVTSTVSAEDSKAFILGVNTLFRMYMGDITYEITVYENMIVKNANFIFNAASLSNEMNKLVYPTTPSKKIVTVDDDLEATF